MEKTIKKVESIEEKLSGDSSANSITPSKLLNSKVTLRDYQLEGLQWITQRYFQDVSVILGDEMGLGKTLQTIAVIAHLLDKEVRPPFLVVAPLSVVGNWIDEFALFAPSIKTLKYTGNATARDALRQTIVSFIKEQPRDTHKDPKLPFDVLVTTYELIFSDVGFLTKFNWRLVVADEAQRLKNSQGKLYKTLMEEIKMPHVILLSGTPIQNNLRELWSLLHFVMPKVFDKLETFLEYFSEISSAPSKSDKSSSSSQSQHSSPKHSNDSGHAPSPSPREKKIRLLHRLLRPFILRRVKEDVLGDLPAKKEVILYTGLSEMQMKYYKWVLTKDMKSFARDRNSLMNVVVNLRKCCNHPYLFNGAEPMFDGEYKCGSHIIENSGKLVVLDKLLPKLKAEGEKVLVFSQMTRMLDILQDYLDFKKYAYERLDGSVRGDEREITIKQFKDKQESFVFLLSTRAGGLGLNLTEATVVIFIDSDWNPQADLQAQARVHRIGQKKEVRIIRLVTQHSVEEVILRRAYIKLSLKHRVLDKGNFNSLFSTETEEEADDVPLSDVIKYGLARLLQSDHTINDDDINTILAKGKEITPGSSGKLLEAPKIEKKEEHREIKEGKKEDSKPIERDGSELFMQPTSSSRAESQKAKESLVIERGASEEGINSDNYYYFDGVDYSQQQQTGLLPGRLVLDQWADGDESALDDANALDSLRAIAKPGKKASTPALKKKKTVMIDDDLDDDDSDMDDDELDYSPSTRAKSTRTPPSARPSPSAQAKKRAKWEANQYRSHAVPEKGEAKEPIVLEDDSEKRRDSEPTPDGGLEIDEMGGGKPSLPRLGSLLLDPFLSESIESAMEDDEDEFEINFVTGDASKVVEAERNSIILLCCDNSGQWTNRGFFGAIGALSPDIEAYYRKAHEMGDLHVGDCHLVPVRTNPINQSNLETKQYVALLICQSRNKQGVISTFNMKHFATALGKVAWKAKTLNASVHLPRLGADQKTINYYSIERLVQNLLAAEKLDVYIYYYPKKRASPFVKSPTSLANSSSNVFDMTMDSDSPSRFPSSRSQGNFVNSVSSKSFLSSSRSELRESQQPKKRKFESDSSEDEISIISSKPPTPGNQKKIKIGVSISSDSDDDEDRIGIASKSAQFCSGNNNNSNRINLAKSSQKSTNNNNTDDSDSPPSLAPTANSPLSVTSSRSSPTSDEKKKKPTQLIRLPSLDEIYSMLDRDAIEGPFQLRIDEVEESEGTGRLSLQLEEDDEVQQGACGDTSAPLMIEEIGPGIRTGSASNAMEVEKKDLTKEGLTRLENEMDVEGDGVKQSLTNDGAKVETPESKRSKTATAAVHSSGPQHSLIAGQRYHLCSIHFTRVAHVRAKIVASGGVIDVKPGGETQFLVTDQPGDQQVAIITKQFPNLMVLPSTVIF